jgi:dihydroorotate dehydrogenase (NAD+) catalytic subunit
MPRPRSRSPRPADPRLATRVGSVALTSPVLAAAGTAGHGAEFSRWLDPNLLGALVVKSVAPYAWEGNPAPRLHPLPDGSMMNSVGLQGPGVVAWAEEDLPGLRAWGARSVVSIWGRSVEEYGLAAEQLAAALVDVPAEGPGAVVAVEVNLSCPNLHAGSGAGSHGDRAAPGPLAAGQFAQDPEATRAVLAATAACGRPRWAKLTAAVTSIGEVAAAAVDGGAAAVVCINTLPALAIDVHTRRPVLGAGPGGLSGPAIHPVAVRAVWDVRRALPTVPIVGVGGVTTGVDAIELMMAGASAVEVGTATFADPSAPVRIALEIADWCTREGVRSITDLVGVAHA